MNRERELLPSTNVIDIYVYNPADRDNDSYIVSLDLGADPPDPPYTSIPVTSAGPYTIEIYASHHQGLLNLCYTAIKSTGHVPGSGTIYIEPARVQYAEITAPAATVTHGQYLDMQGDLKVFVDIAFEHIGWVFAEFNCSSPSNNFYLESSYSGFTNDSWQPLDFGETAVNTTNTLGASADFDCASVGLEFTHPFIGKNYTFFYWNPGPPDDPDNPEPLYTVTVNP